MWLLVFLPRPDPEGQAGMQGKEQTGRENKQLEVTIFKIVLNLLGWHWFIRLYKFQVYSSIVCRLYVAWSVHHPKPSLLWHHVFDPLEAEEGKSRSHLSHAFPPASCRETSDILHLETQELKGEFFWRFQCKLGPKLSNWDGALLACCPTPSPSALSPRALPVTDRTQNLRPAFKRWACSKAHISCKSANLAASKSQKAPHHAFSTLPKKRALPSVILFGSQKRVWRCVGRERRGRATRSKPAPHPREEHCWLPSVFPKYWQILLPGALVPRGRHLWNLGPLPNILNRMQSTPWLAFLRQLVPETYLPSFPFTSQSWT